MLIETRNGTLKRRLVEAAKFIAYRAPGLSQITQSRYPYGLEPAQILWLAKAIEDTRDLGGCIVEVGVAQGWTTSFLNEHMKQIGDRRPYYCVDTFSGFLEADVAHEVEHRGKIAAHYRDFRYNDRSIFEKNQHRHDYANVTAMEGDAGTLDWSGVGKISVMLLDVDLYAPTIACLNNSSPYWSDGARILLDVIKDGSEWDGAYQAYHEFVAARGLTPLTIGHKGGAIVWNAP